jgi:hypothetical protein
MLLAALLALVLAGVAPADAFPGQICSIERISAAAVSSSAEFFRRYHAKPVILTNTGLNERIRANSTVPLLRRFFGHRRILLADSSTYSSKQIEMSLAECASQAPRSVVCGSSSSLWVCCADLDSHMGPVSVADDPKDTFVFFGDHDRTLWSDLLSQYQKVRLLLGCYSIVRPSQSLCWFVCMSLGIDQWCVSSRSSRRPARCSRSEWAEPTPVSRSISTGPAGPKCCTGASCGWCT